VGFLAAQVSYFYAVRDVGVAIATLIALGLAPVILTAAEAFAAAPPPSRSPPPARSAPLSSCPSWR
jgi:DME family drug/metabolite transporter